MDSNHPLQALHDQLLQKREAAGIDTTPPTVGTVVSAQVAKFIQNDDKWEERRAAAVARDQQREQESRSMALAAFYTRRGERYAQSRLGNFECVTDEAREVVKRLHSYCELMLDEIARGTSVVLFGSVGTGKDHLLSAMSRVAIKEGRRLEWWNGMDLFGEVRDRIGADESERNFIQKLTSPDVLYISDPLPPVGALKEFQMQFLSRVFDARYSRSRPTWVSVNVASRKELEDRMGVQAVDRLCHDAVVLPCFWPSFRNR